MKAFTRDEQAAFIAAVLEVEPCHYPLFFTMSRIGVRLGEGLALQWNDPDFGGRDKGWKGRPLPQSLGRGPRGTPEPHSV